MACLAAVVAVGCREDGSPSTGQGTTAPAAGSAPVRFAAWGDAPYTVAERALVARLVDEVNAAGVAFTVNVGDLKGGGECDDGVLTRARETFDRFAAPLVYVPGDNEWTDCWGSGQDPLERLAAIRRTMYPDGRSFGRRPITLDQQRPDHPEHSRWQEGGLTAIGLHVVGSNNNHVPPPAAGVVPTGPPRSEASRAAAEAEFRARDEAVAAWLRAGFDAALAARSSAVAVFVQADPRLHVPAPERAPRAVDGYDRFVAVLVEQAGRFPGPVVLVHGDTHFFRHDQPFSDRAPNVVRIEVYGSPLVGWVEVTVDPAAAEPVTSVPHRVDAP